MPQWAQHLLRAKDQRIAQLQDQLKQHHNIVGRSGPETEDGILINPYRDEVVKLPLSTHIRHWIEPGTFAVDVYLAYGLSRLDRPSLYISGYGVRSGSSIAVHPSASNAVHITAGDDRK